MYKSPITWIGSYFLFKTILIYLWINSNCKHLQRVYKYIQPSICSQEMHQNIVNKQFWTRLSDYWILSDVRAGWRRICLTLLINGTWNARTQRNPAFVPKRIRHSTCADPEKNHKCIGKVWPPPPKPGKCCTPPPPLEFWKIKVSFYIIIGPHCKISWGLTKSCQSFFSVRWAWISPPAENSWIHAHSNILTTNEYEQRVLHTHGSQTRLLYSI